MCLSSHVADRVRVAYRSHVVALLFLHLVGAFISSETDLWSVCVHFAPNFRRMHRFVVGAARLGICCEAGKTPPDCKLRSARTLGRWFGVCSTGRLLDRSDANPELVFDAPCGPGGVVC